MVSPPKFRYSTVVLLSIRDPKHQVAPATTFLFGFYFHERCFMYCVEEAETVAGSGKAALPPFPPRLRTPPLPLYKIARRRKRRRGRSLTFPSCFRLPSPHKRNSVDLPIGRAPLVRRIPSRDRDFSPLRPDSCTDHLGSYSSSPSGRYITGQSCTHPVPPHLVPCPRYLSNSPAPCSNTSDTQTGSAAFVLTNTINESDDHLPSFFTTASGTFLAASLIVSHILPKCNAKSCGISLAPAPLFSSLHLSPALAISSLKPWIARPLDHTFQSPPSQYDIKGASSVNSSCFYMPKANSILYDTPFFLWQTIPMPAT